jgi:hypothetical protein
MGPAIQHGVQSSERRALSFEPLSLGRERSFPLIEQPALDPVGVRKIANGDPVDSCRAGKCADASRSIQSYLKIVPLVVRPVRSRPYQVVAVFVRPTTSDTDVNRRNGAERRTTRSVSILAAPRGRPRRDVLPCHPRMPGFETYEFRPLRRSNSESRRSSGR